MAILNQFIMETFVETAPTATDPLGEDASLNSPIDGDGTRDPDVHRMYWDVQWVPQMLHSPSTPSQEQVTEYTYEVLVVNDGSTDSTANVALRPGLRTINLDTNQGHGHALHGAWVLPTPRVGSWR